MDVEQGEADRAATAGDGFVAACRAAAAPIALWALHFALSYGWLAAGCRAGADRVIFGGLSLLHWVLVALTLPVVCWFAWLIGRGVTAMGREPAAAVTSKSTAVRSPSAQAGRIASAAILLVAVIWETLPQWWLPLCGR